MVCCAGHLDMVKLLVEELNIEIDNHHLHLARMEKREDVADSLVEPTWIVDDYRELLRIIHHA